MMRHRFLPVVLVLSICGAALSAPGTVDDSQRDFNVPGKDPASVVGDDFKSTLFQGFDIAALKTSLNISDAQSPGGFAVASNQNNFPITNFAGVSTGLLVYNPNGQNSFHVHQRANELVTVIKGGPLDCEIVDTTGKLFKFTLNLGDTGFFPQGLIHSQQNGPVETLAIQHFSSANPGVQRTVPALFAGSAANVATAFNGALGQTNVAQNIVRGFPVVGASGTGGGGGQTQTQSSSPAPAPAPSPSASNAESPTGASSEAGSPYGY